MSQPVPLSPEISVTSDGSDYSGNIIALNDKSYLVTWTHFTDETEQTFGQIYNADGTKRSGLIEFGKSIVQTALLSDGRFVTLYYQDDDASGRHYMAQIYNADGSISGSEIEIGKPSNNNSNDHSYVEGITALADGGFTVAIDRSIITGHTADNTLSLHSYTNSGVEIGTGYKIDSYFINSISMTALSNGNYVSTYQDQDRNSKADLHSPDGTILKTIPIAAYTGNNIQDSHVTTLKNGDFVIVWDEENSKGFGSASDPHIGTFAQIFTAQGDKIGDEVQVQGAGKGFNYNSNAVGTADGGFAIAYTHYESSTDTIYLTTFMSDGTRLTDPGAVTSGLQSIGMDTLSDGSIVFGWTASSRDHSSTNIHTRTYANLPGGGTNSNDMLIGHGLGDTLMGGTGNDTLIGTAGVDKLDGGAGNDTIYGKLGADILAGGAGKDVFVFDAKVTKAHGKSNGNVDTITDFSLADKDAIYLSHAIFKGLNHGTMKKPAHLKKDYFSLHKTAHDMNDHVLFDTKSGNLYYDADGNGHQKAVLIAHLPQHLAGAKHILNDIFVV